MSPLELLYRAKEASLNSYSPFSNFKVGAALLCNDGSLYLGTNIENVSFSATICAERSAVASAVVAGNKDFKSIAVIGSLGDKAITPCGVCRQVLAEFKNDITVHCTSYSLLEKKKFESFKLSELLPHAFNKF